MAEKDKKYYWLKLKRDFFKRHDIQIIESMPNGKDYILFYLKLLCESVDHDGCLRFNEQIPYNEQMLSTITNTNVDIVRGAISVFASLKMMEVMDDGTYYMSEVNKMLGSETYWAQKKREQRERQLEQPAVGRIPTLSNASPMCPSKSIEKEIELEIEREQESVSDSPNPPAPAPEPSKSSTKSSKSQKPTKHKYGEYSHVLLSDEDVAKLKKEHGDYITEKAIAFLDEYIEMKGYKAKNHYLAIRKWVIDAVKERERKSGRNPEGGYGAYGDSDKFFEAAVLKGWEEKDPPKTAADDKNLRERVEAMKERLGQ